MSTPQELLELVNAAIKARLEGGAYDSYAEGGESFKAMSLAELRAFRAELQEEVAVAGGATFSRIVPINEGNGCG